MYKIQIVNSDKRIPKSWYLSDTIPDVLASIAYGIRLLVFHSISVTGTPHTIPGNHVESTPIYTIVNARLMTK